MVAISRQRYARWLNTGIIRLLLLVAAGLSAIAASSAAADDPLTVLIARARTAINYGRASAHSIHVSGTINIGGLAGTYDSWTDMSSGHYAEIADAGPFSGSSGYDGTSAWNEDVSGIVFREAAPEANASAADKRFEMTNSLFAANYGGAAVSYLGNRNDNGQAYEAITVKAPGGYPTDWWFNSATALPERRIVTMMGRTTTTVLGDYRNIAGRMIPFSQAATTDNDYTIVTKVTNAEADPPDVQARLRIPESRANDYALAGTEARVPIQVLEKHIFVNVMINGKGPFHFLFDSGAFNLMDPTVAYQAGGQVVASVHWMGGLGAGMTETQYIKADTVSLGGATISNQYFNVTELGPRTNYIPFFEKAWQEMQGLIGYEFLARYRVTIDYANSQLILRMPQAGAGSDSRGAAVPLMFGGKHVFVSCSLAGVPSACLVDTGNSFGVSLAKPFIDAHPQVLPRWYTGTGYIGGVNGRSRVNFGQLSSLAIGSDSVPNVDAVFSLENKGGLSDPFFGALIGNPVLRRFKVTFDYPNATMYLAPNANVAGR